MISTHILDTAKGTPAAGVSLSLKRLTGGQWTEIAKGATNADGRFHFEVSGEAGTYQILFDVEAYLAKESPSFFYTQIPVIFKMTDPKRKYHVPLLLNPYGYSTYRGS